MREDILDDEIYLPKAKTAENAREILRLKGAHAELHAKVSNARKAIYWLTGLTILGAVIECAQYEFEIWTVGIYIAFIAIYVAAAIVAQKKPTIGIVMALGLLTVFQIIVILGDPTSFFSGLIVKAMIAYFLIVGLIASREYFDVLKGLKSHGINVEGSDLV